MEENKNPVIQAEQVIIQQSSENKPQKAKSKKKVLIVVAVIVALILVVNIISGLSPAAKAEKAIEKIDPAQEYYIGRAVAAQILSKYELANEPELENYLNQNLRQ